MNEGAISRMADLGVNLFRLNLSHMRARQVAEVIEFIRSVTSVDICLDTEGAQIRTGYLIEDHVVLHENSTVRIPRLPVAGDSHSFNLYPPDVTDLLRVGDFITLDTTVICQVVDRQPDAVILQVMSGGRCGRNRAVTLERDIKMSPLTEKDIQALAIGRAMGIRYVALSFAHRGSDVDLIRQHALPDAFVISKIECLAGLANLEEIMARSDALLIDRGDLSRQVPLEKIPMIQKKIIATGKKNGVPVYVATNLLESMVTQPAPTGAEINDIVNTMIDGADGLVLASETAIGRYPIGCVAMVRRVINFYEDDEDPLERPAATVSLLNEPHAGELIQLTATHSDVDNSDELTSLVIGPQDIADCDLITSGAYSPLTGFLNSEALRSVLEKCQLPDGTTWTMPIALPLCIDVPRGGIATGQRLALRDGNGTLVALMDVSEIFEFDFSNKCKFWFGSDATSDPRIARLLAHDGQYLAGVVRMVRRPPTPFGLYQPTPQEMRYLFTKKDWQRVIAFHVHSPPHRAHEQIQLEALQSVHADGMYVSVETGALYNDDFDPSVIVRAYQILFDLGVYPPGKVITGGLASYGRGDGAREAVHQAIIRKNMGFTHILFGRCDRDGGQSIVKLFDKVGNLGITPIFLGTFFYQPETRQYVEGQREGCREIDARQMRLAFHNGKSLPDWFMHWMVQDFLRSHAAAGKQLFVRAQSLQFCLRIPQLAGNLATNPISSDHESRGMHNY